MLLLKTYFPIQKKKRQGGNLSYTPFEFEKTMFLPLTDTKSLADTRMTCIQSHNLSLKPKEFKCL